MCGVCLSVDPVCLLGGACSASSDADCVSEVRAADSAASTAVSSSSRSSVDEHVS